MKEEESMQLIIREDLEVKKPIVLEQSVAQPSFEEPVGPIDEAEAQKLHTMIAVIDAENQDSIVFHERLGFQTIGVIKESGYKFDRWLHSVLMQRFI